MFTNINKNNINRNVIQMLLFLSKNHVEQKQKTSSIKGASLLGVKCQLLTDRGAGLVFKAT